MKHLNKEQIVKMVNEEGWTLTINTLHPIQPYMHKIDAMGFNVPKHSAKAAAKHLPNSKLVGYTILEFKKG